MSAPRPALVRDGLAVYRLGRGEPLLLMPGPHRFERPGERVADAFIAGLTALGRAVVSFDPPGSGRSSRPARLGMEEMHACAGEALDAVGATGPVDALGHSMAGLALLAFALERPERIRRLILVGTGSGGPAYMRSPGALWNRSHPAFPTLAARGILHILWPTLGPQRWMTNHIERMSFVDPALARPEAIAVGDWFRPRVGRTDWHRIARRLDYAPRLGEIRVPTLVLCGRFDPQFPPAASEQLAARIPGARLAWFERSGHYPHLEEPERFWHEVAGFLAEAGAGAGLRATGTRRTQGAP